jgi:Cu(I)/Ag(I) efflux system membrane fusion protein
VTTLTNKRPLLGIGAGAAAAVVVATIIAQYLRAGWPFSLPAATEQDVHEVAQKPAPMEEHAAHVHSGGAPEGLPPGYAAVTLDPNRMAGLQLTTAIAEERGFGRTVRTVGAVTLDETRSAHVHSKVRGWIDGIHVNFVGQKVTAGQALCSIYSQEVYSAEIEFLSLLGRATGQPSSGPLLVAARQRLALWDVPKSEIERLQNTREPRRTFPLLAPVVGTVVAKAAIQGMYVDPSLELYTLSDLSRVWVLADVYEADVPYVRIGDAARLTLQGEDESFDGKVSFLSPTIDEATRTRKVRFELANKTGRLLPGAFVTVELNVAMGKGLAIPEDAVIRTGERSIVFVVHGEHGEHIIPREVKLGGLVGDYYRVDAGLGAGDRVATGAQFLLDSESRLRASSAPGGVHVH